MFAARLPTTRAQASLRRLIPRTLVPARNESSTSTSFRAESPSPLERRKHPRRGGQNLSDRYHRLERSLREKSALAQSLEQRLQHFTDPEPMTIIVDAKAKPIKAFRGLVIPEEPRPPESDECCMSGCAICVYDLYQESLDNYKDAVKSLRASLSALDIPQSQWPESIREDASQAAPQRKNVTLSAFEEMERRLAEKHAAEARAAAEGTMPGPVVVPPEDRAAPAPLALVSKNLPRRRKRRSRVAQLSWGSLYEGARWLLFSNR